MKRLILAVAILCAALGFTGVAQVDQATAAGSCSLTYATVSVDGSYIRGFGQVHCTTYVYRTLRVCIVQEGVTKACGTTYGNALDLYSSPTCSIIYSGPYRSYASVKLTYPDGSYTYWSSPIKYVPNC